MDERTEVLSDSAVTSGESVGHPNWNVDAGIVGARVRAVRGDITQDDFARRIRVAQATVSRIERGERLPDAATIVAICTTSGCDANWLLTGEGRGPAASEG